MTGLAFSPSRRLPIREVFFRRYCELRRHRPPLIEAGIESYFADYRLRITTYYRPSSATHVVPLTTPNTEIPTPLLPVGSRTRDSIPPAQLAAVATFSDENTVLNIPHLPALAERCFSAQPLCRC